MPSVVFTTLKSNAKKQLIEAVRTKQSINNTILNMLTISRHFQVLHFRRCIQRPQNISGLLLCTKRH